ncbi:hypothetical protein BDR22DRAFT_972221 [Usnea florida]
MQNSKKRALQDTDRSPVSHPPKRRRQNRAPDTTTTTRTIIPSNPSIPTSPPTLIGSPAPSTPSQSLHSSTLSDSSSLTSSSASESEESSSEESASVSEDSTSSSEVQYGLLYEPCAPPPPVISPSTTSTGSDTSTSTSEGTSGSSSSSSSASESDDSTTTTTSSSLTNSSSSSSALSSLTPNHPTPPLTATNLSHLQSRLNALLPKLKTANAILETERRAGKLEERDIENLRSGVGQEEEGGGYIEMDLGLGVWEEKGGDGGGWNDVLERTIFE